MWPYWAWRIAVFVLRALPARLGYVLADACGWIAFEAWPRGRRNTLRNFRRVEDDGTAAERRRLARASLQGYCRYLVEFARLPKLEPGERERMCREVEPFERLREVARGRGAIIVPMHFGNWDAGAVAAITRGFELAVVADRFGDSRLDDLVFGARERLGMRIVPAGRPSPSIARTLRRGGLVALLIDRPELGTGVIVPFFGADVEVPRGPARLALRTDAALVPVAFPRLGKGSPEVGVLADFSIRVERTGDGEVDETRLTAALMASHERFIRCYPEQWYMFREMWPRGGARRC
jgi:KDO2-lipid IV(A) lauroyltransferase